MAAQDVVYDAAERRPGVFRIIEIDLDLSRRGSELGYPGKPLARTQEHHAIGTLAGVEVMIVGVVVDVRAVMSVVHAVLMGQLVQMNVVQAAMAQIDMAVARLPLRVMVVH